MQNFLKDNFNLLNYTSKVLAKKIKLKFFEIIKILSFTKLSICGKVLNVLKESFPQRISSEDLPCRWNLIFKNNFIFAGFIY